jgi:hypothetical protein
VKIKYRIKNNITEPVSLFLKTTMNNRARTNDSNILTPMAIRVVNTLFSPFPSVPWKKIARAASEIIVNPPVSSRILLTGKNDGEILFRPKSSRKIIRAKARSKM